ncbi:MAG: hypothetical protein OXT67_10320, partial [Zetaproteobacteria bacterium]|nr:hypothetical protein [Zetaproteobacteria bacterium]
MKEKRKSHLFESTREHPGARINTEIFFNHFSLNTSGRPTSNWRAIEDKVRIFVAPTTTSRTLSFLNIGDSIHVQKIIHQDWFKIGVGKYVEKRFFKRSGKRFKALKDMDMPFEVYWSKHKDRISARIPLMKHPTKTSSKATVPPQSQVSFLKNNNAYQQKNQSLQQYFDFEQANNLSNEENKSQRQNLTNENLQPTQNQE